jgi:hypothetical protein
MIPISFPVTWPPGTYDLPLQVLIDTLESVYDRSQFRPLSTRHDIEALLLFRSLLEDGIRDQNS